MSITLETPTALLARSACVSEDTRGLREPMSIALETSTALPACSTCVSEDTPGLGGRADVNRARHLDGAVSTQRTCVTRHTWFER